jgi:acyl-CoA thioesterase YciA
MTEKNQLDPELEILMRVVAMPADTNAHGNIFGGWIMSQMDLAASNIAHVRAKGRVVTIAVDGMVFLEPVYVGDVITCYGKITKEGRTSLTIHIEVWAMRDRYGSDDIRVTEAKFTFVAVNDEGEPTPLPVTTPSS